MAQRKQSQDSSIARHTQPYTCGPAQELRRSYYRSLGATTSLKMRQKTRLSHPTVRVQDSPRLLHPTTYNEASRTLHHVLRGGARKCLSHVRAWRSHQSREPMRKRIAKILTASPAAGASELAHGPQRGATQATSFQQ